MTRLLLKAFSVLRGPGGEAPRGPWGGGGGRGGWLIFEGTRKLRVRVYNVCLFSFFFLNLFIRFFPPPAITPTPERKGRVLGPEVTQLGRFLRSPVRPFPFPFSSAGTGRTERSPPSVTLRRVSGDERPRRSARNVLRVLSRPVTRQWPWTRPQRRTSRSTAREGCPHATERAAPQLLRVRFGCATSNPSSRERKYVPRWALPSRRR